MSRRFYQKNFELLKSDPETMQIFRSSRVLGAYRRDSNLKDYLVHSNLQSSMNTGGDSNGIFPCCRPRCKTCAYSNSAAQINTLSGPLTIRQKFACTTSNLIYIITCRTCTLCTLAKLNVGSATDSASISAQLKRKRTYP